MRGRIKEYDKLVMGSGIAALMYAVKNSLPLIQNSLNPPRFFEEGCDLWGPMALSHSIAGNIPFGDKVESVRVGEGVLKINTKDYGFYEVGYEKLFVFDDENVQGLGQPIERATAGDKRMVLDWINVKSGMVHKHDEINTDSDFIRKIYFYQSKRVDGNHDKKDAVCISYLNKEELGMVEYSNSYLRLKLLNLMKEHGIRGEKNGFTKRLPKRQKYRAIRVEHAKREIIKIKQNRYKKTENVEFLSQNMRDLAKNYENDNLFSNADLSKVWGMF